METPAEQHHAPVRALFKNMLHGSGLYMLANFAPRLMSFVLVPIVTRHLTTADYGVLDLLQQSSVVLSLLLGVNFAESLGFFFFETGADRPRVVGTALGGALLLGLAAGAIGWMLADPISRGIFHSSAYVPFLRFLFAALPFSFLLEAGMGWLRVENRAALFAGLALLRTVLAAAATIVLLLVFDMRVGGVLGANVGAGVLITLAVAALAVRAYRLGWGLALWKRMLRFSSAISLGAIAAFLTHFGDRFVIAQFRPKGDWGVYAMAYNIGMLISIVQSSLGVYWASQIYQIIKRPDAAWVFARSFTYYIGGLLFCGLGLLVAARPTIHLLTTPAYFPAARIVPIILAAYLLRSAGDFLRLIFMARGCPHYEAISSWITAAVAFGLYFIFIPRFGIEGAAFATLITFAFAAVVSLIWVHRVWPYQLELGRLAKLAIAGGAVVAIYFAWPQSGIFREIASGGALLTLFVAILLALRFATPGEMNTVFSAARRLKAAITRA